MENSIQFKKNFIWNILGTSSNAFSSLFFMIMVTRINGVDNAGIYTIAFSTACILYIIGIYAGRIFQVTENEKINDKEFIVNRIISCCLMLIISLLFIIIKQYNIYKALIFVILCLYKALEAFSDVLYGIMQKNNLLNKVGKSMLSKALISLISFFIIDFFTKNLCFSCLMIVISNILIIIIYDIKNIYKITDLKQKVNMKNILKIFKTGFFVFAISFLGIYIMNAPKYAIDDYLNENIQAIFGIIIMPATVVGLFAQFIIHPYLNTIVDLYKKNDVNGMKKIIRNIIFAILILGLLCVIGAYLLGIPVLQIIYGIDLNTYKYNLVCILIASTLSVIASIYSSLLTTIRKTFIQFIIYCINAVIAICSSYLLTYKFEINGATIAYFIIMLVQFVLYYICTNVILKKIKLKE